MRRVALIYNPESGQHSNHRGAVIQDVLAVLRREGVDAEAVATTAPGSAAAQACDCRVADAVCERQPQRQH